MRVTDKYPLGLEKGPCWEWVGAINKQGYGRFRVGQLVPAHRYSYERAKGAIPLGLEPDHLCRNHPCVNPQHLEAVTRSENNHRGLIGILRVRTQCKKGHVLTEDNSYYDPKKKNHVCRPCRKEYQREWARQKRGRL